MLDGPSVVAALKSCGVTHVIWIPDSELGTWEPALLAEPALRLIRVCREGEAMTVAAGLLLGGKKPIVLVQCTGLFEAGDALRNVVHDLKLLLFLSLFVAVLVLIAGFLSDVVRAGQYDDDHGETTRIKDIEGIDRVIGKKRHNTDGKQQQYRCALHFFGP